MEVIMSLIKKMLLGSFVLGSLFSGVIKPSGKEIESAKVFLIEAISGYDEKKGIKSVIPQAIFYLLFINEIYINRQLETKSVGNCLPKESVVKRS